MWLKHLRSRGCSCGCWGCRQSLGVHGVPLHSSPRRTQHPARSRWAFLPLAYFFPPPLPVIYFISPHPAALPWERGGSPGWMRLSRRCTPGPRCRQPAPGAGYGPGPGCTPGCGVTHRTHRQHPGTPRRLSSAPQICAPGSIQPWGFLHCARGAGAIIVIIIIALNAAKGLQSALSTRQIRSSPLRFLPHRREGKLRHSMGDTPKPLQCSEMLRHRNPGQWVSPRRRMLQHLL